LSFPQPVQLFLLIFGLARVYVPLRAGLIFRRYEGWLWMCRDVGGVIILSCQTVWPCYTRLHPIESRLKTAAIRTMKFLGQP
jgi:hypothetical protein